MPSTKNPRAAVNPGPGKLSSGVATASAFIFPGGGGSSSAALQAHLVDPVDAHMANAVGVNALNAFGFPIRDSAGGIVDGESLREFIDAVKDMYPVMPNHLGVEDPTVPNTGIPSWNALNPDGAGGRAIVGAFTRGTFVIHTQYLAPDVATIGFTISGMLYPADRGVLALYHTNELNYITGTLVSALWLGSTTAPAGMPPALGPIFSEGNRYGYQVDYTPAWAGLDQVSMVSRLPYVRDYTPFSAPWLPYASNFYRYQLAFFFTTTIYPASRDAGDWFIVQWKEFYATTLAAIQPIEIAAHHLNPNTAYSANNSADWTTLPQGNVARVNVYSDPLTDPAPSLASSTSDADLTIPGPTFIMPSGLGFCNGNNLRFNLVSRFTDLFTGAYFTGTGPFTEPLKPMVVWFNDFGYGTLDVNLEDLKDAGSGMFYSDTNAPAMGSSCRLDLTNWPLTTVPFVYPHAPGGGWGSIMFQLNKPFQMAPVHVLDPTKYFFNSCSRAGGSGATDTLERFVDEDYRYATAAGMGAGIPMLPLGGNIYDSTVALTSVDQALQVINLELRYPGVDYSVPPCFPASNPDYAAVLAGESFPHYRKYKRLFDVGASRSTGRFRIAGLPWAAFESTPNTPGTDVAVQPGGAKIEVFYPAGLVTVRNMGRLLADTVGGGCVTAVTPDPFDIDAIYVDYDTTGTAFINGEGKYPICIVITFINNDAPYRAGPTLHVTNIEWMELPVP